MARRRQRPARYKETSSSESNTDSKPPPKKSKETSSSSSSSSDSEPPTTPARMRSFTVRKPVEFAAVDHKNQITCLECKTKDNEEKMYLCQTCHELKFNNERDVKKNALCSNCTLKKHVQQEHQIVDFFPYLSAHRFSTHSKLIAPQLKNLENARTELSDTISMFNNLTLTLRENHKEFTNMARRSKSVANQLMIFEKMESFMAHAMKLILSFKVKQKVNLLQNKLESIEGWHSIREIDCVDNSQIVKLDENTNLPETAIVWKTLKVRKDANDW